MDRRSWSAVLVFMGALVCFAIAARFEKLAHAQPVTGIYAETSTAVDGVTVRRVRDRGEGVVCYVASREEINRATGMYASVSASIVCMRER